MSPVAVGAEEKRVTRCWVGLWDLQASRGAEMREKLGRGAGGQSEGGGKENVGGCNWGGGGGGGGGSGGGGGGGLRQNGKGKPGG